MRARFTVPGCCISKLQRFNEQSTHRINIPHPPPPPWTCEITYGSFSPSFFPNNSMRKGSVFEHINN